MLSKRLVILLAFVLSGVAPLIGYVQPVATKSTIDPYGKTSLPPSTREAESKSDYELIASLPVGDGGVHYENVGVPEIEMTGPTSFRAGPDGTFFVADTAKSRIVAVSQGGAIQRHILIPDAIGIADLALAPNGDILALDLSEQAIHRVKGRRVGQKTRLPDRLEGVTGISVGNDNQPLLELKGGSKLAKASGEEVQPQLVYGKEVSVSAPDLSEEGSDASRGELRIGGKSVAVKVANLLGGLQVIGFDKNGDVLVSVVEISSVPTIKVDETIRRYDKDLNLSGVARVPLAERFTHLQRGVSVDEGGNVYAMIPRPDRLDIVRLSFKEALQPILPDTRDAPNEVGSLRSPGLSRPSMIKAAWSPVQAACTRTRSQMASAAAAYLNNQTYLSSKNLTGYCLGRTAPRYLGTTAGYKASVPYDWGGFDSVSGYNGFMSQGYQAGDIQTCANGCVESCSKGVDCSGFVSRVWGLTTKYSTTTLPNISTRLWDVRKLQRGDILNLYNSHVVIFNGMENGGINAWESTVYASKDRVVYGFVSWTRLSGYVPYKYNGACDTGSVSLSVSPTNVWVSRGSTAYFTVYAFTSDGFRGSVNLYALNLPGAVLSGTGFYPQTINVSSDYTWFSSTLKIVTNSTTPTGSRTITIEGRSGDRISRAYVQLNVF